MDYDDVTMDDPLRWPLHWSGLMLCERWAWFDRLWQSVCAPRSRYGLPVRSRWWESDLEVEALAVGTQRGVGVVAAFTSWISRHCPPRRSGALSAACRSGGRPTPTSLIRACRAFRSRGRSRFAPTV